MTWFGRVTFRRISRLLPLIPMIVLCASCSDFWVSNSSTATLTVSPTALILKAATAGTPPTGGDTSQLSASGTTVGGVTTDETTAATWTSSNAAVATVGTHTGLVSIVGTTAGGTAVITATFGGQSATSNLLTFTGTVPAQGSIAVNFPTTNFNPSSVAPGTKFQVTAFATLSGISTNISSYVTWTSSAPSVATVDANGNVTVLSTAGTLGSTSVTITATATFASGNVSGTNNFSVI